MPKKARGKAIEVTPEWVALARARMIERGLDQTGLAKEIKAHKSTVTRLFTPPYAATIAFKVADHLAIPRPYYLISSLFEGEWLQLGLELKDFPALRERALEAVKTAVLAERAATVARDFDLLPKRRG